MGISNKIYWCLKSLYTNVTARIKQHETGNIEMNIGLKQGCVACPTLYLLYLADLPHLIKKACMAPILYDCKVAILMFSDDIVIFVKSEKELQLILNVIGNYFLEKK